MITGEVAKAERRWREISCALPAAMAHPIGSLSIYFVAVDF